jgi:hypothetical protein
VAHMIVKGGTGNRLTYTLTQTQSFALEALSADIDTTAAGSDSSCDAILRDNAGLLIARCRSSVSLKAGQTMVMTFAPELPDTETLLNILGADVITSGLAATTLPPGGSVAVQVSDPAATVTQMRLWVEDVEDGSGELEAFGAWAYVPGPGA